MNKTEEKGATALIARLRAAQKCDEKNFWLAFHFDPLLLYPGCEAEYLATIDAIFTHVRPQNIAWISFGALRFMPELKTVIQEQHPESEIVYGEFARGEDGKCRYFKPLRQKLFSKLYHKIKNHSKEVPLYFCMERPDIYEKITGNAETSESVQAMLDQRVFGNK
jgi:spore photoproduct lyase